jgi:hypothetical protein
MRIGLYSLRSPSQIVSVLRVTIPRARANERLAGGQSVSRAACGVAMLTLLRLPF